MEYKISLNFQLKDLSGAPIKDKTEGNAGKLLGNALVAGAEGDVLKYYQWGCSFYQGKFVILDQSDFEKLKKFTESTPLLAILGKAQILESLNEAAIAASKKNK